jgi:hypothetical protein
VNLQVTVCQHFYKYIYVEWFTDAKLPMKLFWVGKICQVPCNMDMIPFLFWSGLSDQNQTHLMNLEESERKEKKKINPIRSILIRLSRSK